MRSHNGSASLEAYRLRSALRRNALAVPSIAFCLMLVLVGVANSPVFLSPFNIGNVIVQVTALLLVSIGQSFAVSSGGLDLSVGSIVSLAAVVTAVAFEPFGIFIAILLGFAAGLSIGLINGIAVGSGIEPFLVTMANLSIAHGLALFVSPVPSGKVPAEFGRIASFVGAMPVAFPFVLLIAILAMWFVNNTRTGVHIVSVGGGKNVARLSGIPVEWTYVKTYLLSATMAVLAGLFLVARTRTGDPTIGGRFTLDSLAAVVLGGTVLGGGRITIVGTIFGALALGLLSNVLNLLQVPTFYQTPVKGLLVIGAVLIPSIIAQLVERRKRNHLARAFVERQASSEETTNG
jgi:ribose transport system permease protein